MSGGGERLLLLRSGGGLWGVDQAAVREVARRERGYCVRLAGEHDLHADDVVGVVEGVAVRPAGGAISRYWSEAAAGLAVHAATPLVVVDPERPPRFLRVDETESDDGDDRQADD
jgi:hypothetical protein